MEQAQLGICYYPATVGLIDDNKEYLKHLTSRLVEIEELPCVVYDSPEKALDFLTNQYRSDSFINRCLTSQESDEFDHLLVELDITAIRQEIYNPQRSKEVSVLVIDYAMPGIDGLELARLIRENNPYIKIIMLTGQAGQGLAISAFNEGTIDQFILKTTPNVMVSVVDAIRKFNAEYFLNLSAMALNKIAAFSKKTLTCLEDPSFVAFFKQLCEKQRIVEYYLLDIHGSFLLFDMQGRPSLLAVADEEIMATYQRLTMDDPETASSILQALSSKQKIPYFHTKEDFATAPADWGPYLHPAQMIQGKKETYCCAYIENPSRYYELELNRIISYRQFLEGRQ